MDPRERYDEICDDLAARDPRVELSQMMGMPCIKVDGKMIGGFATRSAPAMVFKLPDERLRAEVLALDGAELWEPGGSGKVFKEWVRVPATHEAKWVQLADAAVRLRSA